MTIAAALKTSYLSSDRCIGEYAEKVRHIQPCKVPPS